MKKIKKYLILLLIISFIGIFLSLTYSFAKYVKDVAWEYHLKSKGFYLSSLELNTNPKNNVKNSWTGDAVYFTLNNSQNDELITDYDINYEVTCEILGAEALQAECHLNGTNSSEDTGILASYQGCINNTQDGINVSGYSKSDCELEGYVWKNQVATKDLYFEIVPNDPEYKINIITVNIKIKSTSPYKKTLEGNFTLYKNENNLAEIQVDYYDFDNSGKLILANHQNQLRCLNLKWDSNKLLIEENLLLYDSYEVDPDGYIKEINFSIESNSSKELIFFKKEIGEITTQEFIISDCVINED